MGLSAGRWVTVPWLLRRLLCFWEPWATKGTLRFILPQERSLVERRGSADFSPFFPTQCASVLLQIFYEFLMISVKPSLNPLSFPLCTLPRSARRWCWPQRNLSPSVTTPPSLPHLITWPRWLLMSSCQPTLGTWPDWLKGTGGVCHFSETFSPAFHAKIVLLCRGKLSCS